MVSFKIAAVAAALVSFAGAASAATETFDFTGGSNHYSFEESFGGSAGSSVAVTAYSNPGGAARVGHFSSGLGVCNSGEVYYSRGRARCSSPNHTLDGSGYDEFMRFSFSGLGDFTVTQIAFSDYGSPDRFNFSSSETSASNLSFYNRYDTWSGSLAADSFFTISATRNGMAAKIRSITIEYGVSEVPLPAAGFLLLGGLGGLAALKRRRKA